MTSRYSSAGVNNAAEARVSEFAGRMCQLTSRCNPLISVTDLRGDSYFRGSGQRFFRTTGRASRRGGSTLLLDGIGRKPELYAAAGNYCDAAVDILTATWGDAVRHGALPTVFAETLVVNSLNVPRASSNARMLLTALGGLCQRYRITLFTGETCQHGVKWEHGRTEPYFHFEWYGMMAAMVDPARVIFGRLQPGQIVIAVAGPHLACNGSTAVIAALQRRFGRTTWWRGQTAEARQAVAEAAQPPRIVEPFLQEINGWGQTARLPVAAVAHLTGGGFVAKFLCDLLIRSGVSAVLDNLYPPPAIMEQCREWLGMDDEECYRIWHCGQRFLIVLDPKYEKSFLARAAEARLEARRCGVIVKQKTGGWSTLTIHSKFGGGRPLHYRRHSR